VITIQGQPLPILLSGSDPEGDLLTFALVSTPTFGLLSGTPPNLVYEPQIGFRGQDAFTFTVQDGSLSSPPATVSIEVKALPVAQAAHPRVLVFQPNVGSQSPAFSQTLGALGEGNYTLRVISNDPGQLAVAQRPELVTTTQSVVLTTWGPVETTELAEGLYLHQQGFGLSEAFAGGRIRFPVSSTAATQVHRLDVRDATGASMLRDGFFSSDAVWQAEEGSLAHETSQWSFELLDRMAGLSIGLDTMIGLIQNHAAADPARSQQITELATTFDEVTTELGDQFDGLGSEFTTATDGLTVLFQGHVEAAQTQHAVVDAVKEGVDLLGLGQELLLRIRIEEQLTQRNAKPLMVFYLPESEGGLLDIVFQVVEAGIQSHETAFGGQVRLTQARDHVAKAHEAYGQGLYVSAYNALVDAYIDLTYRRVRNF